MSSRLTSESRIYADKAKDLNRQVSFIVYIPYTRQCNIGHLLQSCLVYIAQGFGCIWF